MAADFWCEVCQRWTAPETPEPDEDDLSEARGELGAAAPPSVIELAARNNAERRWREENSNPVCSTCGEPYHCGECGYEINATGECQRPISPDTGYCPESVNLPTVPTVTTKGTQHVDERG